MKITMLYYFTICRLMEEYEKQGYTWDDLNAIIDHDKRVKYGDNLEHTSSLEHMFYCSHMGGAWDTYPWKQNIIDAFVEALREAKESRMGLNPDPVHLVN